MFKNYFLSALRHFKKNKVTTIINVVGLSMGLTAALFVFLVIQYNFSFDRYEPAKDRMYRVVVESPSLKSSGAPLPLYAKLAQNTTGVENVTAILAYNGNANISIPERSSVRILKGQGDAYYTDTTYFRLFPHSWLAGSAPNALRLANQIVLTQSRLERYFPGLQPSSALGKVIVLDDSIHLTVSGVVEDLSANSTFDGKLFISLPTIIQSNLRQGYGWDKWGSFNSNAQTLLSLKQGTRPDAVNAQLAAIFKTFSDIPISAKTIVRLQLLNDVHINTDFDGTMDKSVIERLMLLATVLVLLGAINFINLATAESTLRAREMGIKKVLGISRRSLVIQYLLETGLLMLVTTCLCVVLTLFGLRQFLPDDFKFNQSVGFASLLGFIMVLSAAVSLLAGLYPALVVSGFRPVQVLKDRGSLSTKAGGQSASLRKALTISQFVVAQLFVIGVIVVNKQVHFAMNKDMGFRKDAILLVRMPTDHKREILLNALHHIPEIQKVSLGGLSPAFSGETSTSIKYLHKSRMETISTDVRKGDSSWLAVYQIHLLAGHQSLRSDSAAGLVINETMSHNLGFGQAGSAVGQTIYVDNKPRQISGVVEDFNQGSIRTAIRPLYFEQNSKAGEFLHVALQPNPSSWKIAIDKIQDVWKVLYPREDFNYEFLNDEISRIYRQDQMLSQLLSFCAAIAISISCLGLLGLVIFITNTRSQEISIRKVLGASGVRIFGMLSIDLLKWIVLAFLIAAPIAFWGAHLWLQGFAYKTPLSWWVFVLGGAIMLAISFAVIAIRTLKAAIANPISALRSN
ncbi:MAG: ABC transporter permease [Mucilaginibacter sp.]